MIGNRLSSNFAEDDLRKCLTTSLHLHFGSLIRKSVIVWLVDGYPQPLDAPQPRVILLQLTMITAHATRGLLDEKIWWCLTVLSIPIPVVPMNPIPVPVVPIKVSSLIHNKFIILDAFY